VIFFKINQKRLDEIAHISFSLINVIIKLISTVVHRGYPIYYTQKTTQNRSCFF